MQLRSRFVDTASASPRAPLRSMDPADTLDPRWMHLAAWVEPIRIALQTIDANIHDRTHKRAIFIYGPSGCGKTHFVKQLLAEMGHEHTEYSTHDVRNSNFFESLAATQGADFSVRRSLELAHRDQSAVARVAGSPATHAVHNKRLVVLLDNVHYINNEAVSGGTAMLKILRARQKPPPGAPPPSASVARKAKKFLTRPVICIANHCFDAQISELRNLCYTFEFPPMPVDALNALARRDLRAHMVGVGRVAPRVHIVPSNLHGLAQYRRALSVLPRHAATLDAADSAASAALGAWRHWVQRWCPVGNARHSAEKEADTWNEPEHIVASAMSGDPWTFSSMDYMDPLSQSAARYFWHENFPEMWRGGNDRASAAAFLRQFSDVTQWLCDADQLESVAFVTQNEFLLPYAMQLAVCLGQHAAQRSLPRGRLESSATVDIASATRCPRIAMQQQLIQSMRALEFQMSLRTGLPVDDTMVALGQSMNLALSKRGGDAARPVFAAAATAAATTHAHAHDSTAIVKSFLDKLTRHVPPGPPKCGDTRVAAPSQPPAASGSGREPRGMTSTEYMSAEHTLAVQLSELNKYDQKMVKQYFDVQVACTTAVKWNALQTASDAQIVGVSAAAATSTAGDAASDDNARALFYHWLGQRLQQFRDT